MKDIKESWLDATYSGEDTVEENYCFFRDLPSTSGRAARLDPPGRLSGNLSDHILCKIICSKTNKRLRRRCRVCYANKKRSDTGYMCKNCGVALHIDECFRRYHTELTYF